MHGVGFLRVGKDNLIIILVSDARDWAAVSQHVVEGPLGRPTVLCAKTGSLEWLCNIFYHF